jgi:hypothetical protein
MKTMLIGLFAATVLGAAAEAQPPPPDPAVLAYKLPAQIDWKGDPKTGPLAYVLWGDPTKPGPYAILAKWPAHQMSRPHIHPHDRHVTVLQGVWWVGTGKTYAPETTTPLPAGTVVTHFAGQWHYDGAKDGDVILEIVGEGPQ